MDQLPPPPVVAPDAPIEVVYRLERETPLTDLCLQRVIQQYQVHPLVLTLVATVEGGWAGAKIKNTDGSHDLGLMQINTIHLPELARYGLTENMLRNNECINLGVASWYIRRVTKGITLEKPQDYFRAIARYHSKNEPHVSVYAEKLMAAYARLIEQHGSL